MFYSQQNKDIKTGFTLLAQAISSKDKGEDWQKDNMDILENIGLQQIEANRERFADSYRIMMGDFNYQDIMSSSMFLQDIDFWRSQTDTVANIEHYGFIEPIVNSLVNIFSKRPNPYLIDAIDPLSTNDYIREKTDRLWKSVTQQLEERIQRKAIESGLLPAPEFKSEEEQQAYEQQLNQFKQASTPQEIEKEMNTSYKPVYMDWIEKTLEEDYTRFDQDELDRDCMYDYLQTGKCFKHYRVGYDFYAPERWKVIDGEGGGTFCDESVSKVEKGEFVGNISFQSHSDAIANYGHMMSADDKERITNSKGYKKTARGNSSANTLLGDAQKGGGQVTQIPTPSFMEYENSKHIEDLTGIDLGYSGFFPRDSGRMGNPGNLDKLRVTEVYWQSFQKIGYLTVPDPETGEPISEIVTDEVLNSYLTEKEIKKVKTVTLEQHEKNPQVNTIVWDYIPQTWKGVKISKDLTDLEDDLYLGVKPLEYQIKGESNMYHRLLPVAGINEKKSFISRLQDYQVNYNLCVNAAKDFLLKDWGMFFLFDSAYLPEHLKGDDDAMIKMREMAKGAGFLEIDGTRAKSSFNQFTAINMDMSAAAIQKLQLAKMFKQEALESVGLSEQIMGTPTTVETATGIDQQVKAAYAKIDIWGDKFEKFQQRCTEIHINIAQYSKKEGIDGTIKFTDPDKIINFLNMDDPYLSMRNFRISTVNTPKKRGELERMKQIILSDNTVVKDIEAIAAISSADSVVKVKLAGRYARKVAEIEQQQAMAAQQKAVETEQAGLTERLRLEQEFVSNENKLDREKDIYKQLILAQGFDENKDRDNNDISDVIQTGKLALEGLKVNSEIYMKESQNEARKVSNVQEQYNKEREISLKEKELATKRYVADRGFDIARENKTNAEVSRLRSKK